MTKVAGIVFGLVLAFCVLGPLVSPHEPYAVDLAKSRQGPSLEHPLGTDQLGRDLLTQLAVGGRTSLLIAAGALGLILVFGLFYGGLAAVAGGVVDSVLMRLLDGFFAVPRLLVSIIILVVLGLRANNVPTVIFALAVANWMLTARLVRGHLRALRRRDFVRAAEAAGARPWWVARRHLVPNSLGMVVIVVFLELPNVILGEAFLSALGLGPSAPTATWGNIALDGIQFHRLWILLWATIAITVFAVSANLFADGLDELLDPRRRAGRRRRQRRDRLVEVPGVG